MSESALRGHVARLPRPRIEDGRRLYPGALCSVAGCDDAPREEFPLPEGWTAVACERHCREVEGWHKSPRGAPRGSRLLAFRQTAPPPPGARILGEVRTGDYVAERRAYVAPDGSRPPAR